MQKNRESHPLAQMIYEGVLESTPWETLLKTLEEYLRVHSATLVLRRPGRADPGFTVYLYSKLDARALEDFSSKAYLDSPFAELPVNHVFSLHDRVSQAELEVLDFNEFLKDYDISDLMGFDVYDKQSQVRLRLRLARLGNAPAFSRQDKERLQSIVPIMHKALKLYSAYTHNSFVEEFYEDLLGAMGIASVILNAKLEVLSANDEATRILALGDGVFLRENTFRCSTADDQQKLLDSCKNVLIKNKARRERKTARRTESISIGRSNSESKWDVHIRTIDKKSAAFGEGGPELVLLLQGTERDRTPSQSRLIERFGLTPAEAKLVPLLLEGKTLTAAAKAVGVSRNTARAQLSSVFTKTGVNSQTQLVKLVSDAFATNWQ